jgi:hypothetical protein
MYPGNVDNFVCLSLGSCLHLNTNADLLRDSCLVRFQLSHHAALAVYMDFQVIIKWRFCSTAAVIQEMKESSWESMMGSLIAPMNILK